MNAPTTPAARIAAAVAQLPERRRIFTAWAGPTGAGTVTITADDLAALLDDRAALLKLRVSVARLAQGTREALDANGLHVDTATPFEELTRLADTRPDGWNSLAGLVLDWIERHRGAE